MTYRIHFFPTGPHINTVIDIETDDRPKVDKGILSFGRDFVFNMGSVHYVEPVFETE